MAQDLASLSDAQVQQLLVELFELLPGAGKPRFDEIDSLLLDAREAAPAQVSGVLQRLQEADPAASIAVARNTLAALEEQQGLEPLLEQAQERAAASHMMALPELIGGVLLLLAAMPTHIAFDAKGRPDIRWDNLKRVPAVLSAAADIVKGLPKALLEKIG